MAGLVAVTFVVCLGAPMPALAAEGPTIPPPSSPVMAAESLTITPPPNPTAETTVPIALSGSLDGFGESAELYALLATATCPASSAEAALSDESAPHGGEWVSPPSDASAFQSSPFSATIDLSLKQSGAYLLCGYLGPSTSASAEMTVGPSATESKRAAEARARELAEQAPASLLKVTIAQHHRNSARRPGWTAIVVTTTPYAHVTIVLNHGAKPLHYQASSDAENDDEGGEVSWTCRHPELIYHYVVTAVGGSGAPLRRSGNFHVPLSASKCRALTIAEAHRIATRRHQERREREEEKRREESPRFKIEQAEEEYCRKVLHGRPQEAVEVSGHIYTHCYVGSYPGTLVVVGEWVL